MYLPSSDDEESLSLLNKTKSRHVLQLVSEIVTRFSNVVKQHLEVTLVLLMCHQTKRLLQCSYAGLDFLEDRTNGVDGFVVRLIILAILCTATDQYVARKKQKITLTAQVTSSSREGISAECQRASHWW